MRERFPKMSPVGRLALFGLTLMLSGCGTALTGSIPEPLDTVTLNVGKSRMQTRTSRLQVLVPEPKTIKIFDSQNIVVATSMTGLEYLGAVQWADRLPSLVQVKLAEALQNNGVAGVGLPGQGLAIDYQLITEIRDFSIRVDGNERASVSIYVKLLNDRNGEVVATKVFEAETPAISSDYPAALNAAFLSVSTAIVDWVGKGNAR